MVERCIRDYRREDLEALYALDQVCFAELFRFSRGVMRRLAEARGAISLVAEGEAGELAGFVVVQVEGRAAERRGYIVTLDVAPVWRRGGSATRLLRAAEIRAAAKGAQAMTLHVHTGNEAAVRFYEKAGYARMARRRSFMAREWMHWCMRRGWGEWGSFR